MKRFLIVYTLMSFVIGTFIYVMTLLEVSTIASNEAYFDLAKTSLEKKDVSEFIKFSSQGFSYIDTFEDDTYHIDVVHVKVINNDETFSQLGIFVMPKIEVLHATSLKDDVDLTRAVVTFGETTLYDSLSSENIQYPMSYGIKVIGFYFYAFEFTMNEDVHITLTNYENQVIYSQTVPIRTEFNDQDFIEGFTKDELETILQIQPTFETTILRRLAIFLSIDIFLGGSIYYVMKYRRQQK